MNDGRRPGGTPADEAYPSGSAFARRGRGTPLERALPLTRDVRDYGVRAARGDVGAGLTVAALAVPSSMAYAELAGLAPVVGLYALLLPTVAYTLLGSSRQLVVGPEGALAALVAAAVLPLADAGSPQAAASAAMLALLTGGCFIVARLVRLGWIIDYVSRAVLVGYIHGIAFVIIGSQLPKLLRVAVEGAGALDRLGQLAGDLGAIHAATVAVSVVAIAALLVLRRFAQRVPAALAVVVAAIAVSSLLDLAADGIEVLGVVPVGLPALGLADVAVRDALALVPAAIGIFLVAFADGALTARSFAGARGQHIDANQELLALGGANLAAGLTSAMPVGASGSRTAVNAASGSRSQLAGLVAAAAVLLVLLFLTGPIGDLPTAVLGAVIVVAATGLVDPQAWRTLWQTDRIETLIAASATVGVVVLGVLPAILLAVALSIVDVVRRSAQPHDAVLGWDAALGRYADVAVHRKAQITPGVVVYRLDDRLFYANAAYVSSRIREAIDAAPGPTRALVFDAEAVTHVDTAGLDMIDRLLVSLEERGIDVHLARARHAFLQKLERRGLFTRGGPGRVHGTVRGAVDAARHAHPGG